jgi:hypothetical protein
LLDEWFGREIGQQCEQKVVMNVVERAHNLLPPSRTHLKMM